MSPDSPWPRSVRPSIGDAGMLYLRKVHHSKVTSPKTVRELICITSQTSCSSQESTKIMWCFLLFPALFCLSFLSVTPCLQNAPISHHLFLSLAVYIHLSLLFYPCLVFLLLSVSKIPRELRCVSSPRWRSCRYYPLCSLQPKIELETLPPVSWRHQCCTHAWWNYSSSVLGEFAFVVPVIQRCERV